MKHQDKPTAFDELQQLYHDDSQRKPAQKVERTDTTQGKRQPPPSPSPKLSRTDDLEALRKQLLGKANEYARLAEQARAASYDSEDDSPRDDEVNYLLLETFARNVASRIKRIQEKQ